MRCPRGELPGTGFFQFLQVPETCKMTCIRRLYRVGPKPVCGPLVEGGGFVSIVRVGLAETKNFGEGYDAIFGKKKAAKKKSAKATAKKKTKAKKK